MTHRKLSVSVLQALKSDFHCMPGFVLMLILSSFIFIVFPQLDISISEIFYQKGDAFPANKAWFVKAIYEGVPWMGRLMLFIAIVVILFSIFLPQSISRRNWRRSAALITVVVLGIGLFVHTILKDGMGRPRPRDLQIFAGTTSYVPLYTPSKFCTNNCSFVSGHAAVGFSLMSLGMLSVRRRRQFWTVIGLVSGGVIGAVRIAQGGHFLSDIVFSFLAIWLSHLIIRTVWLRFRAWQLFKMPNLVSRPA